jgi:hypothetical protein
MPTVCNSKHWSFNWRFIKSVQLELRYRYTLDGCRALNFTDKGNKYFLYTFLKKVSKLYSPPNNKDTYTIGENNCFKTQITG